MARCATAYYGQGVKGWGAGQQGEGGEGHAYVFGIKGPLFFSIYTPYIHFVVEWRNSTPIKLQKTGNAIALP